MTRLASSATVSMKSSSCLEGRMDSLKLNVGTTCIPCKRSLARYATRVKLRSRPSRKPGPIWSSGSRRKRPKPSNVPLNCWVPELAIWFFQQDNSCFSEREWFLAVAKVNT